MTKKFKSVQEIHEDIKANYSLWDKFIMNPKMNWLRWLIYNLPDFPRDCYNEVKWFIQRGKRGYSDCDIWGFDYYLSEMLPKALKQLKETKHGIPGLCVSKNPRTKKNGNLEKREWKRAEERWNKYIQMMIDTFETADKILNSNLFYFKSEDYYTKENKNLRKRLSDGRCFTIMTYKQCKAYEEGWRLFQEHFFSLWD